MVDGLNRSTLADLEWQWNDQDLRVESKWYGIAEDPNLRRVSSIYRKENRYPMSQNEINF